MSKKNKMEREMMMAFASNMLFFSSDLYVKYSTIRDNIAQFICFAQQHSMYCQKMENANLLGHKIAQNQHQASLTVIKLHNYFVTFKCWQIYIVNEWAMVIKEEREKKAVQSSSSSSCHSSKCLDNFLSSTA